MKKTILTFALCAGITTAYSSDFSEAQNFARSIFGPSCKLASNPFEKSSFLQKCNFILKKSHIKNKIINLKDYTPEKTLYRNDLFLDFTSPFKKKQTSILISGKDKIKRNQYINSLLENAFKDLQLSNDPETFYYLSIDEKDIAEYGFGNIFTLIKNFTPMILVIQNVNKMLYCDLLYLLEELNKQSFETPSFIMLFATVDCPSLLDPALFSPNRFGIEINLDYNLIGNTY